MRRMLVRKHVLSFVKLDGRNCVRQPRDFSEASDHPQQRALHPKQHASHAFPHLVGMRSRNAERFRAMCRIVDTAESNFHGPTHISLRPEKC